MRDFLEFCGLVGDEEDRGPVAGPPAFLRDYFAAQALTGIQQRSELLARYAEMHNLELQDVLAAAAYELADAMLKARKAK